LTRLLVADDSETVLLMLQRRLEMEGYDVVTATDGLEALERLRDNSPDPDVILLDAMMPNMSGTEVLAQLRESGSKIPVLMISAHLDSQEPDRMRSLGASDCIPKPFEWEDLIGKIEELAANSRNDGESTAQGPPGNAG
jgi:DNA-binding response OmpR family regulator